MCSPSFVNHEAKEIDNLENEVIIVVFLAFLKIAVPQDLVIVEIAVAVYGFETFST